MIEELEAALVAIGKVLDENLEDVAKQVRRRCSSDNGILHASVSNRPCRSRST